MAIKKNILFAAFVIGLVLVSILITVRQTQERQQPRPEAETMPSAVLSLHPSQTTINDTINVDVKISSFVTNISAVSFRILVPFSTGLEASDFSINQNLAISEDWNFPIKEIESGDSVYKIKLAAVNTSFQGLTPTTDLTIASFKLTKNSQCSGDNQISFDMTETKVIDKNTKENILVSANSGTYNCDAISGTITQTPTDTLTPTISISPPEETPTPIITGTPIEGRVNVDFRLEGITTPRSLAQDVKITLSSNTGEHVQSFDTTAETVGDDGKYRSSFVYLLYPSDFGAENVNTIEELENVVGSLNILIKGSSHLQKRFDSAPVSWQNGDIFIDVSDGLGNALLAGDVNDTNTLTIEDIASIISYYTDFSVPVGASVNEDVNDDGVVDITDIALAIKNYTDFTVQGDQ